MINTNLTEAEYLRRHANLLTFSSICDIFESSDGRILTSSDDMGENDKIIFLDAQAGVAARDIRLITYDQMSAEQKRIVDASETVAGKIPQGLPPDELRQWIRRKWGRPK